MLWWIQFLLRRQRRTRWANAFLQGARFWWGCGHYTHGCAVCPAPSWEQCWGEERKEQFQTSAQGALWGEGPQARRWKSEEREWVVLLQGALQGSREVGWDWQSQGVPAGQEQLNKGDTVGTKQGNRGWPQRPWISVECDEKPLEGFEQEHDMAWYILGSRLQ